jgi:[acyl-carrier-protein] S-malonyltransferase
VPEWRLIVAPTSGTFRSGADEETLGTVVARGGERAVTAAWTLRPAEIIEWLVEDGDPVSEGQPLVRVQPREGA